MALANGSMDTKFDKTLPYPTSSGAGAKVLVASTDVIVSGGSGRDINIVNAFCVALRGRLNLGIAIEIGR